MDIQSVKSLPVETGFAYLVNGEMSVPNAPTNRYWLAVQAWIAAGNEPEPADAPSLAQAKAGAEAQANQMVEQAKIRAGIVVGLPGMVAQYASNAFFVERWINEGRPAEPDPADYPTAEAERQGFEPEKSLAQMLATWETMWNGMNALGAGIMLARRRALEAIKVAGSGADVEAALGQLESELAGE